MGVNIRLDPPKPEKRRGCFFYGCITGLVLFVVLIGAVIFGLWRLERYFMDEFTDTEPLEISEANYSPELARETERIMEAYSNALEEQQGPVTLTLTDDEINALLLHDESFSTYDVRAEVLFEEESATGKISLPLKDLLPMNIGKGRYLNGSATLDISTRDGELYVYITSLKVRGNELPEYIMSELREVNLAEKPDPGELPANEPATSQGGESYELESIEIKEGEISIRARAVPE